ncbi:granzyme A-like [Eublepharis macularius]|uniref:Granzyme A-like n=1 Tax=Eublepharis macularius TaxID=481883 RepID=A0AA97JTS0_EUBMA|nr:granzyme A-like [Eublepharis macularius]
MGLLFVLSFSAAIFFLGMHRGYCADIAGGKESVPHLRPYMAALFRGNSFQCGGTLIRSNWVLTAAHCELKRGDEVVLGAHSLSNPREKGKQTFRIIQAFPHRNYNQETIANDIMLLKLNKSATINQYVKTVRLPRTHKDVKARTQCLVAGWGATLQAKMSNTLRETHVTILARGICTRHYNRGMVTTNNLCAAITKQRKGTCPGDSGGPLICRGIQRGITSFGPEGKCAVPGTADVYTRLTKGYLLWINNIIRE